MSSPPPREIRRISSASASPPLLRHAPAPNDCPSMLDREGLRKGLSQLAWSADRTQQVYLRFEAVNHDISDIGLLEPHVHLQSVDVSHNNIQDLSPLKNMCNLLHLNVAHNDVGDFVDFEPPLLHLLTANFSYNNISSLKPLCRHRFLTQLLLDYNSISEISGLDECTQLTHLSLRRNRIKKIENISKLPLKHLDLSGNQIVKIENMQDNQDLVHVDLSSNAIRSLEGMEEHPLLATINLEGNQIVDVTELRWLVDLPLVVSLDLLHNPIQKMPSYRDVVIFNITTLTSLDGTPVTAEQKVQAANVHQPPSEVAQMLAHNAEIAKLLAETANMRPQTPTGNNGVESPILVLVGPRGTHKHAVANLLAQRNPGRVRMSVSHTTRPPRSNEVDGVHYHFVSAQYMKNKLDSGTFFLESMELFGHTYGESVQAVQDIINLGEIAVLCMELEGAKSLIDTHLKAYFVLLKMATTEDLAHTLRSEAQANEGEGEIMDWIAHAQEYAVWEDSGMFDSIIEIPHENDGGVDAAGGIEHCVCQLEELLDTHLTGGPGHDTSSCSSLCDAENSSPTTKPATRTIEIEYSPPTKRQGSAKAVLPPIVAQ